MLVAGRARSAADTAWAACALAPVAWVHGTGRSVRGYPKQAGQPWAAQNGQVCGRVRARPCRCHRARACDVSDTTRVRAHCGRQVWSGSPLSSRGTAWPPSEKVAFRVPRVFGYALKFTKLQHLFMRPAGFRGGQAGSTGAGPCSCCSPRSPWERSRAWLTRARQGTCRGPGPDLAVCVETRRLPLTR